MYLYKGQNTAKRVLNNELNSILSIIKVMEH